MAVAQELQLNSSPQNRPSQNIAQNIAKPDSNDPSDNALWAIHNRAMSSPAASDVDLRRCQLGFDPTAAMEIMVLED
eukprot:265322-Amphidinium_carterae.1